MSTTNIDRLKVTIITFLILSLDQISKLYVIYSHQNETPTIILNLIKINLVINSGAAFSLLNNQTLLLAFISFFVSIALAIIIARNRNFTLTKGLYIGLLLGGTLGNGIDRWRLGHVIDFIELVPINFPVFNIADISINLAMILILLEVLKTSNLHPR